MYCLFGMLCQCMRRCHPHAKGWCVEKWRLLIKCYKNLVLSLRGVQLTSYLDLGSSVLLTGLHLNKMDVTFKYADIFRPVVPLGECWWLVVLLRCSQCNSAASCHSQRIHPPPIACCLCAENGSFCVREVRKNEPFGLIVRLNCTRFLEICAQPTIFRRLYYKLQVKSNQIPWGNLHGFLDVLYPQW
jgi:hypothetical protein